MCWVKSLALPTQAEIAVKSKELQTFNTYRFTDSDIDYIINEKKRFSQKSDKIAEKKIELLKEREEAEQMNELDRVKEIDQIINELNEKSTDMNIKRNGNFNLLAWVLTNQWLNFEDSFKFNRPHVTGRSISATESSAIWRSRRLWGLVFSGYCDILKIFQKIYFFLKNDYERAKEQKDDPFQRRKGYLNVSEVGQWDHVLFGKEFIIKLLIKGAQKEDGVELRPKGGLGIGKQRKSRTKTKTGHRSY